MAATTFICGDDDYIVGREGQASFAKLSEGLMDDFSREVIDGAATNVDGVKAAVDQFLGAVRTLSMFGERKAVWLKGVNFLADNQTGKSEGAKAQVAILQAELEQIDPAAVAVLITASPVDRRRKEFKWFQKHTEMQDYKGTANEDNLRELVASEAAELGVSMEPGALVALLGLVNANTRLVLEELRKLAAHVGAGVIDSPPPITETLVLELVPAIGESDFFEPAEAFFSGKLGWTLDSLKRFFFANKEARPLLASLQNRGRLTLQIRALLDSGAGRRLSKATLDAASREWARAFGGTSEKSAYNLFTQNTWYLSNKIAPGADTFNLKQLIDFQLEFTEAFRGIVDHPNDQHAVIRNLAIRCLG